MDPRGIVYFADFDNLRVRALNSSSSAITVAGVTIQPGTIATVAGNGQTAFSGDGGVPTSAGLWAPGAVLLDSAGNLYISDTDLNRIRFVNTQSSAVQVFGVTVQPGTIQTIAGNGTEGYAGDGGPATSAEIANPQGIALDPNGNLYIADWANSRLREVSSATGVITTLAGGGHGCAQQIDGLGDGCPAVNSTVIFPMAVAIDLNGNVFVSDQYFRIRAIFNQGSIPGVTSPQQGYMYTIAGAGSGCAQQTDSVGDGCQSVDAGGMIGEGLATDPGGSLYIADYKNYRLRRIDHTTGIIATVAGNGTGGYSGDNGPAASAEMSFNSYWYGNALTIDSSGNLYFGDGSNSRVRVVSAAAAPVTFPPTTVGLTSPPQVVTLQNDGNAALYITSLGISGGNASDFPTPSTTCPLSPTPLAAGASCTITLTFSPTQEGTRSSSLVVVDNAPTGTQQIALVGTTPSAPATTTTGANSVTSTSATLNGTVNPNGLDTQVWFRYGPDPALSTGVLTTPMHDVPSGTSTAPFNISVGGLAPSTPYFFQANASNNLGATHGDILSFQTQPGTFTISGQITLNGNGLSGVTVLLGDGAASSAKTDSSGNYAFSGLTGGLTYTVTPSLTGYNFNPSTISFGYLGSNESGDFTATAKKRKGQVISE